ncbi:MAG: hypothetical protein ACFCBW_20485, partial [Candidatus Competibacterales bacterium]
GLGMALSAVIIALAYFPGLVGVQAMPFHALMGWRGGVMALAVRAPEAQFILTDRYTHVGPLAFYWPKPIPVYLVGAKRRFAHYDLWPGPEVEVGRPGLYVATRPEPPPELASAFAHCQALEPVANRAPNGVVVRTFYPHRCRDYRAIPWPEPTRR